MEEEQKYHWRARYISSYFDANPAIIKEVRILCLFSSPSVAWWWRREQGGGIPSHPPACLSLLLSIPVPQSQPQPQVERVLRLDENVLRFFTLRPKTQADLIRARKGFKAGFWAEERTPEKALEAAREQKARLFHEED